jgi:septal ring factor EnvC (AmiA/AmiB activator)
MSTSSTLAPTATKRALRRALLALLAVLPMAGASAQQASSAEAREAAADKIERTRETLERWVEARKTISKEQRDWAEGRAVLGERIELLEREIAAVRAKISEAQASVAEADKKRLELEQQNERMKSAAQDLATLAMRLEEGTRSLTQRIPAFAHEGVKIFSQRIPEAGAETKLSLSERFQSVVAVLNSLNKLHREITLTPEIRELPDGRSTEVATVYVGLSQGYYASGDGQLAGIGTASEKQWTWRPANAHAGEIARMVAILKSEQVADFVRLPIRVD